MQENLIFLPDLLERGVSDIFPNGDRESPQENLGCRLKESVKSQTPLRIKLGIDPTSTDIHLGHSILFRKLRAFQDAGHIAVLIIGDFTAQIGDPSGKSKTRVRLTPEEVRENSRTYLEQLGYGKSSEKSLLDFETAGRLEVRRNSEWLAQLDLSKIIELLSSTTVGQMLAKEEFNNRYTSGTPIAIHEFLYPILQGYDSVYVKADIELGGTDQKFNVAMGRDLQRQLNQSPQFGLLLPILVGLDGAQKMSKSLGNTVGLNEDPLSMYSKLEKISDALVSSYLTLLTDLDLKTLPNNPRELQKSMALAVTASHHGWERARAAQADAAKLIVGSKEPLSDIPEISISSVEFPTKAFYLISSLGLCATSSEARRQIKGGAFRLDGEKIVDPSLDFLTKTELVGKVVQLGKKTFRRLTN